MAGEEGEEEEGEDEEEGIRRMLRQPTAMPPWGSWVRLGISRTTMMAMAGRRRMAPAMRVMVRSDMGWAS